MSTYTAKILIIGLALILTAVSGYLLANSGKPYGVMVFTIHKLSALASVVLITWSVYQLSKSVGMRTLHPALLALTGVLFLVLFVSGALLSLVDADLLNLDKSSLQASLRIHQLGSWLAVAATTAGAYLLYLAVGSEV